MKKQIIKLFAFVLISILPVLSFAEEEIPFTIGDPIVNGNGCPEGSYDILFNPDTNKLTLFLNSYTAKTREGINFNFANCNIAVPIDVQDGITVGLIRADYHGEAYIPEGGIGYFSRQYFLGGQQGSRISSTVPANSEVQDFTYYDEVDLASDASCGEDVLVRVNTTILVSKPTGSPNEVFMSLFSEDSQPEVTYQLSWKKCGD